MGRHWRIYPHDPARIGHLERSAGIPAVVAQLLICRGIYDPREARQFLEARLSGLRDPHDLPGIEAAAERIDLAVRAQRRIVVYGDYDADGMTATAILNALPGTAGCRRQVLRSPPTARGLRAE